MERSVASPLALPADFGKYRILGFVGRGGMGAVYRAVHKHLGADVALKILTDGDAADERAIARFRREMQAIGRIVHPNVVRALDAGEEQGISYLAMEFISGADVAKILRAHGPLAVADACEIARQAAAGLEAIAAEHLVHRDIKPGNLLVDRAGTVKIGDLGLASFSAVQRAGSALTTSGDCLGTADYMAPEQASGDRPLDIRADLYSLGCTLFKLLVGRAPFECDDYSSFPRKIWAHTSQPPPSLAELRSDTPPELCALLESLLAKDPAARPSRPAEIMPRLAALAGGHDLAKLAGLPTGFASPDGRSSGEVTTATYFEPTPGNTPSTGITAATFSRIMPIAGVAIGLIFALWGGWNAWHRFAPIAGNSEQTPPPQQPSHSTPISVRPSISAPELAGNVLLDQRPRLVWHRLLEQKPLLLRWPEKDALSTWNWDGERQQVSLHCSDVGLLQLGSTQASDYTIQLALTQPRWTGGLGLFLGYRLEPEQGPGRWTAEFLMLRESRDEQRLVVFELARGQLLGSTRASGEPVAEHELWATERIDSGAGEQILEVRVEGGRVSRVRWGAAELPILISKPNQFFPVTARSGPFGVVVSGAGGAVHTVQFMRRSKVAGE